ncbi:hypothetical protein NKI36_14885 [Mesorhizobium caraganae]|uniref:DUF982 domain-containing protein n=1 Tax=Mesorhizobium caraganae TaxID=483206 RepID=A0ABV1YZZ3_9HYPH
MQKAKTWIRIRTTLPLQFFAQKHELSLRAAKIILYSNGPSRVACDGAALAFLEAVANHQSMLRSGSLPRRWRNTPRPEARNTATRFLGRSAR